MIVNGTTYKDETPPEVIDILERFRQQTPRRTRLRVHYGDTNTGQDWGDVYDVEGYIGRSLGPVKIPLLIANAHSTGGDGILDHCIVRIRYANRKDGGDLYRHPNYAPPAREKDFPAWSRVDWERNFA